MTADTQSLIARLEAATGPDRELDAAIAAHLKVGDNLPDWAARWEGVWRPHRQGYVDLMHSDGRPGPNFKALTYTASIDAALTLVPDHLRLVALSEASNLHGPAWFAKLGGRERGGLPAAKAPTPALAIVIAALRAIEARQQ